MSIASEIERIQTAKESIRISLENKTEETVPESLRLEDYPSIIDGIKTKGTYQSKMAIPSTEQQNIYPDVGYDALSNVLVDRAPLEETTIIPKPSGLEVLPSGNNIGFSKVTIPAEYNLTETNVKNGVTIYGVTGSYGGDTADLIEVYDWLKTVGAVIPADKNTENLLETVKSISQITYYTVTFDTVGGTGIADQEIVHGHTIEEGTYTVKSGYSFTGWKTSDGEDFTSETPVTKDLTLVAQWRDANAMFMENDSGKTGTNAQSYLLGCKTRLGTNIFRYQIKSITFLVDEEPPANIKYQFDVSYDNDGGIMCYIDTSMNMYYIGSGGLTLPQNASTLFGGYRRDNSGATCPFNNLKLLHTNHATNMSYLFNDLYTEPLDLSNFDTSNVTDMSYMFNGCKCGDTIDVSSFDTSNVTTMDYMFSSCKQLKEIDVSNFETNKLKKLNRMFDGCTLLTKISGISGWDVSKVYYKNPYGNDIQGFTGMFGSCSALSSLDLSGWENSSVTNMSNTFSGCTALTSVDLSGMTGVTRIGSLFSNCTSMSRIDIRNMPLDISDDYYLTGFYKVPNSCAVYVYDEAVQAALLKEYPNLNLIAVRKEEEQ